MRGDCSTLDYAGTLNWADFSHFRFQPFPIDGTPSQEHNRHRLGEPAAPQHFALFSDLPLLSELFECPRFNCLDSAPGGDYEIQNIDMQQLCHCFLRIPAYIDSGQAY
jgi:hypothetical protein